MRLDLVSTNGVVLAFVAAAAVILLAFIPAVRTSAVGRPSPGH
jgi:hypothetical protein